MKCPDEECTGRARVVLTRDLGSMMRRIRECDTCDRRFTTEEIQTTDLLEVKRKPRKDKPIAVRVQRRKKSTI